MAYLTPEQIEKIKEKLGTVQPKLHKMMLKLPYLRFQNERAAEFMQHGYLRRVSTLARCIENAFSLIPMETEIVPERDILLDTAINIQAFYANVYGCIDNLAWVWVYEKGLDKQFNRTEVGLRAKHGKVRATLSTDFQSYLVTLDEWFGYMAEYRDAVAHRIPLYVPPGGVKTANVDAYNELERKIQQALYVQFDGVAYERLRAEQEKLVTYQPIITHSYIETTARFAFHVQMVVDFMTVDELGEKMLDELGINRPPLLSS
jgi:hypothetical protein